MSLMHYNIALLLLLLFTLKTSQQISIRSGIFNILCCTRVYSYLDDRSLQSKRWFHSSRSIVTCGFPQLFPQKKGSGLKDNQTTSGAVKKKNKQGKRDPLQKLRTPSGVECKKWNDCTSLVFSTTWKHPVTFP